jgi:mediator of RNA polymerase II transcription subunit 18
MSQPHAQGGHAYEISLSGEFFPKDLKPILNRFTLHSESAQPIHIQEYTFDPPYAEARKKAGMEVIQMRAKRAVTVEEGATGDGEFW